MKDPHMVLYEKENQMERLRKEIRALRVVIPLLAEGESSVESMQGEDDHFESGNLQTQDGMLELKRYYPFVRHMPG